MSDAEHSAALDSAMHPFIGKGVDFRVSPGRNDKPIELNKVVVPNNQRGEGVGHQFMGALTDHADTWKKTIALTPSTDFGASSVNRLKGFYKEHGFVENKGKNRDFEISHSMYRTPSKQAEKDNT